MLRLVAASWVVVIFLFSPLAGAETEPPPQALKYHRVLAKRPSPGYLFDRFFNAWLDHSSVEELEKFLVAQTDDPGRPADGLLLAFFYSKQGDDVRAIEQFRATLADDPGNAAAWYEKGVLEARTLDFETALSDLEKASEANPDDDLKVQIAKLRGKLLVRSRKRDEALKVFRKLVEDRPDNEELAEDVIEMQLDEGLYKEATASAKKLIEKTNDPYRKVLRRLRLGDIRQRAGKRSEAVAVYGDVLKDVGAESWLEREILSQIERTFRKEYDVTGLKKQYEKLLETYPRRVGIRRGYARVLADAGEGEKAVEAFREILEITPGDRANQEAFIALYVRVDDLEGARKQLESLISQHPDDAELYVQLAELSAKTKEPKKAAEAVDKFLAKSDKGEYDYLRAARLLERLELTDAAKEKYVALTEAFPDSPSAKEARAAFLYKTGDKEHAIELWRKSAASGEAEQAIRVAKALSARQEHQAAYDLLSEQIEQAGDDGLFLDQIIKASLALKKYDEAIPLARKRVDLATNTAELEDAIAQASKAIERGEKVPELIAELEANSKTAQRKCLLSELYEQSGDVQRADDTLAPMLEAGEVLAFAQQIRLARLRRDWPTAIDAARRLLDLPEGRKSRNVRQLVEFHERAFQIDEALEWIPEWKKLSPGSTSPWLTEARLRGINGENEQALEILRTALREFDDASDIRSRLATLYMQSGKLADAERIYWRDFEEAEDITDKLRAVEQLARVAEQQGKTQNLVENFEEQRRENRESIEPLLALAAIHRISNNYEKRLQVLGEAAKLRPDDVPLLKQIAHIQEQEGEWELARDTLQRAAEIDETDASRQQLARLHLRWGNSEEGYKILYDMLGEDASGPRDIESIAEAMISNGDWERAAEFLAQYVEKWPEDYRLRYLLGVAQEEVGDELFLAAETFLAVMNATEELQTVKSQTNPMASHTYYQELAKIAPPGMQDLIQTAQLGYTVYQHRQQQGRYAVASYAGSTSSSPVTMPGDVNAARQYALMHVAEISPLLEDEQAESVRESALRCGVPAAEVILTVERLGNNGWQLDPQSMIEKFPDDDAVLAYAALMGARSQLDPAVYKKVFNRLADKWPQLAVMTFTTGALGNDELGELTDRALKLLKEIEAPSSIVVMQLCTAPMQRQGTKLPEEYEKVLRAKLIEWYPTVRDAQPYGQYIFSYMSAMLSQEGDLEGLVKLLDDEVARSRSELKSGRRATASPFFYRQQQSFLTVPGFPPSELQHFPASVLGILSTDQGMRNPYTGQQTKPDWDKEEVLKLLPNVNDPTLRMLLAHSVEADEYVTKAIDELMADETPTLDAYLLAASWANEQEKPDEAIELLEKARYLPMDRKLRRVLDAFLVALVLEEQDTSKDKESEELKQYVEVGQAAALRLRHGSLQQNERNELATALEELGLEKEAERLTQATPAATASHSAPVYSYSSSSTVSQDRIQHLIDSGKQDAAAKLLSGEVTGMLRQYAGQPSNRSYMNYQFRQLVERLDGYGLRDAVLKQLDPGETTSHRKVADYAMALAALDKPKQAIAMFTRAVEMRPREDSYRVQLIAAKASVGDFENVTEHFDHFGRNGAGMLAMEIISQFSDHQGSIDERLKLVEMGIQLLQHQKDQANVDLSWAPSIRQSLSNPQYTNGRSLPSLYAVDGSSDDDESKNEDAIKRRELHDRLCREMLKIDELADDGFTGLLASHEAAGEVDESFVSLAQDVIERKAKKPKNTVNQFQNYVVNYSNNRREIPQRTAGEFLVRHAWENDDWTGIDDEVLPALDEQGRSDLAREVKDFRELYQCDAEDFPEVAKKFVHRAGQTMRSSMFMVGPVNKVCEIWQARKLDIDVQPLLLDFIRKYYRSGQSGNVPPFVITYMEQLVEKDDEPAAIEWLETVTEIYIGPKEKRADLISKQYSNNGWSYNSPNGAMHMLGNMLEQALQRPQLVNATTLFIAEGEVGPIVQNAEYRIRSALDSVMNNDVAGAVSFLEQAKFLSPIEELRLNSAGLAGNGLNLFEGVVEQLNQHKSGSRGKEIAKRLAEREEQTVGVLMLRCVLTPDAKLREQMMRTVGEKLNVIEDWDVKKQQTLARHLAIVIQTSGGHVDKLETTEESGRRAAEWLTEQLSEKYNDLAEKILKAKSFNEFHVEGHRLDEWLGKLLPTITASDPHLAARIYLKVTGLYDQAMSTQSVSMYYSRSTAAELLPQMVNYMDQNSPLVTKLMIALIEGEGGDKMAFSRGDLRRQLRPVTQEFNKARQAANKNKTGALGATREMYEWLKETFGDDTSPVMATAYTDELWNYDAKQLEPVEKWLAEQVEAGDQTLAPDLLAATRSNRALKLRDQEEKDVKPRPTDRAERAEHHEHYESILLDGDVPLGVRLTLADFVYDVEKERLPLSTARALAKVGIDLCQSELPMDYQHERNLAANAVGLVGDSIAGEYLDAWLVRFVQKRRSSTASQYPRSPYEANDSYALLSMLRLCYDLDRDADAKKIASRYENRIGNRHETIALLIEAGALDQAVAFTRRGWKQLPLDNWGNAPVKYNATLRENLSKALEKLTDPPIAYILEAAVARLPNEPGADEEAIGTPDSRLTELAGRYDEIPWPSTPSRVQALAMLRSSSKALELTREALSDVAKDIDLVRLSNNHSSEFDTQAQLVFDHANQAAEAGDPQHLVELLKKLVTGSSQNEWRLRNLYQQRANSSFDAIVRSLEKGGVYDEEDYRTLAESFRVLVQNSSQYRPSNFYKANLINVLSHLFAGESETYLEWCKAFDNNQRNTVRNAGGDSKQWQIATVELEVGKEGTLQQRIDTIAKLIELSDSSGWVILRSPTEIKLRARDREHNFKPFEGVFSKEEMAQAVVAVAEKAPANGATWVVAASELEAAGAYEAAAEAWSHASDALPQDKQQPAFEMLARRILALHKAELYDRARELLPELAELGKSSPSSQKRYDEVAKEISSSSEAEDSAVDSAADSKGDSAAPPDDLEQKVEAPAEPAAAAG